MFDIFLPAVCIVAIIYNILIALNGEEGIRAHGLVQDELEDREQDLAELKARRQWLERRADLLSARSLDADMLDESARRVLGYAAPGEYAIPASDLDTLVERLRNDAR